MDSIMTYYIILLTFLCILITGFVGANDYSVTMTSQGTTILMEGSYYNIPHAFERNQSKSVVNRNCSMGSNTYRLNQETFVNSRGDEIIISVVDYDDYDVDAKNLYRIYMDADEKNMKCFNGYMTGNESFKCFTYANGNNVISIKASDEDIINQVLIPEEDLGNYCIS